MKSWHSKPGTITPILLYLTVYIARHVLEHVTRVTLLRQPLLVERSRLYESSRAIQTLDMHVLSGDRPRWQAAPKC